MVLRHGYNVDTSIRALQICINKLVNWGETCNLKFNPSKTLMIVFTTKKSPPTPSISIQINNKPVTVVKSLRYLGVTLDSRLNWDAHRNITIQNAKKSLITISQKISNTWGPKPHISKWIYTGIIRPKLIYAAMTWGHTLSLQKNKLQYEKLNRLALLMITPTRKTISTASLEVMYDLIPLDLICLLYTSPSPRD